MRKQDRSSSIFKRLLDRVFPSMPDFFTLLAEQSAHAERTVALLVTFMETADEEIGLQIRREEHEADAVKIRNIQTLNEAFATPMDREDIYRAIIDLDEIVNYCKTTVHEMNVLGVTPGEHLTEMATQLHAGVAALARGFAKHATEPTEAEADARAARKAERNVEKAYRAALADLFQGTDYIRMFKRREIYRHLSNSADRLAHCADTLSDIVVKIS
jgi:uncharacterized protein Yka (UPF0111/DUF47 family)